jgi:hypothetical protein
MTTIPPVIAPPVSRRRPALSRRQKNGAAIAGIGGFLIVNLGWLPFILVGILFAFTFVIYFINSVLGGADSLADSQSNATTIVTDLVGITPGQVIPFTIGACVIGVILIAAGIVFSIQVLKRHGVNRPVAVTWVGLALAIVGNWIFSSIFSAITYFIGALNDTGRGIELPNSGILAASVVVTIVYNALLGWLCWWWMAYAMRAREPAPPPTATS